MIHIEFDPERLSEPLKSEWNLWQESAERAICETIKAWETSVGASSKSSSPNWDREIWAELKKWLLKNVFHGKCAYCETLILRFDAHAEHFRPKGRVTVRNEGQLTPQVALYHDGREMAHPGYFWLAYHWKNLLPSCGFCNGGAGKLDQFPVQRRHIFLHRPDVAVLRGKPRASTLSAGWYYLQPEDLDVLEGPRLLHPYVDQPCEHLCFGDRGIETALTEKGHESIEIYNLKCDILRRERQRIQSQALTKFLLAYGNHEGDLEAKKKAGWAAVDSFKKGIEPYSAAACDYINEALKNLGNPLAA